MSYFNTGNNIGVYGKGIVGANNNGAQKTDEKTNIADGGNKQSVNPNNVLDYLEYTSASVVPKKTTRTVEVSNYMKPEDIQRMEAEMKNFEAQISNIAVGAINEFGVDEGTADAIGLAYMDLLLEDM